MPALQHISGPNSNRNKDGSSFGSGKAFADYDYSKDTINQANTVPLQNIFNHLKLKILPGKNTCPFHFHSGGNEKTPSFLFYKDSNSFYCFGCGTGSKAVDFVSKFEGVNKQDSAKKILSLFQNQAISEIESTEESSEKLLIMNRFSNLILNFRFKYFDINSFEFIENICKVYDDFLESHELSNEALIKVIKLFEFKIKNYKG